MHAGGVHHGPWSSTDALVHQGTTTRRRVERRLGAPAQAVNTGGSARHLACLQTVATARPYTYYRLLRLKIEEELYKTTRHTRKAADTQIHAGESLRSTRAVYALGPKFVAFAL